MRLRQDDVFSALSVGVISEVGCSADEIAALPLILAQREMHREEMTAVDFAHEYLGAGPIACA